MIDLYKILETLGIITIGSFSIVGLIGFFGKKNFEKYIESKLEEHKNNLQILRDENQIRYSKLHEERAEVIKQLYKRLVAYDMSTKNYLTLLRIGGDENKRKLCRDAWHSGLLDFVNYYDDNLIYFPPNTCLLVSNFLEEMKKINQNISSSLEKQNLYNLLDDKSRQTDSKEYINLHDETFTLIFEIIEPIKKELENEFREFLGVR